MLDNHSNLVLKVLEQKAPEGYKVLEKSEILQALPAKSNVDEQTLTNIIALLNENEFVDVKYQDKTQICLCITPKSVTYLGGVPEVAQRAKITNGQVGFLTFLFFTASFLGALVATLIANLF